MPNLCSLILIHIQVAQWRSWNFYISHVYSVLVIIIHMNNTTQELCMFVILPVFLLLRYSDIIMAFSGTIIRYLLYYQNVCKLKGIICACIVKRDYVIDFVCDVFVRKYNIKYIPYNHTNICCSLKSFIVGIFNVDKQRIFVKLYINIIT